MGCHCEAQRAEAISNRPGIATPSARNDDEKTRKILNDLELNTSKGN
jgi:hypothetical protein